MGLTRPTAAQIDSSTEVITDPISLLNNKSNRANVDVGFLFNRDGGISSNVAVFWQESSQQFVFALTSSNAVSRFSNIVVTSNANVVTGNVFAAGYFYSNGVAFTGGAGGSYSNVQLATYLATTASNIFIAGNTTHGTVGAISGAFHTFVGNITQITSGGTPYFNTTGNVIAAGISAGTSTIGSLTLASGTLFRNGSETQILGGGSQTTRAMIRLGNSQGMVLYGSGTAAAPNVPATGIIIHSGDGNVQIIARNNVSGGSRIQLQAELVEIQSNITPVGNLVYNIGNVTNQWNTVYASTLQLTGNLNAGSLTSPGALNTLAGNVSIYGASSMLNVIGNIVVNNTAIASSNVTGAIRTTGGIGVGGNLYVGQRVGYVWGANNVSSVYQVFNNTTNSLDTVFG